MGLVIEDNKPSVCVYVCVCVCACQLYSLCVIRLPLNCYQVCVEATSTNYLFQAVSVFRLPPWFICLRLTLPPSLPPSPALPSHPSTSPPFIPFQFPSLSLVGWACVRAAVCPGEGSFTHWGSLFKQHWYVQHVAPRDGAPTLLFCAAAQELVLTAARFFFCTFYDVLWTADEQGQLEVEGHVW